MFIKCLQISEINYFICEINKCTHLWCNISSATVPNRFSFSRFDVPGCGLAQSLLVAALVPLFGGVFTSSSGVGWVSSQTKAVFKCISPISFVSRLTWYKVGCIPWIVSTFFSPSKLTWMIVASDVLSSSLFTLDMSIRKIQCYISNIWCDYVKLIGLALETFYYRFIWFPHSSSLSEMTIVSFKSLSKLRFTFSNSSSLPGRLGSSVMYIT